MDIKEIGVNESMAALVSCGKLHMYIVISRASNSKKAIQGGILKTIINK